jgi:hypothetical protein
MFDRNFQSRLGFSMVWGEFESLFAVSDGIGPHLTLNPNLSAVGEINL